MTIGCSLSTLIDDYAFQKDCSNLTSISFGTISEINIDTGAFQDCKILEQLYLNKSLLKYRVCLQDLLKGTIAMIKRVDVRMDTVIYMILLPLCIAVRHVRKEN